MYKVLIIKNNTARIHKKTKSIIHAQVIVENLMAQGVRAYYIKSEVK